jgi:glycine cleavage system H protein
MTIPAELKYSKEHEWVKLLDDKTALVGITDFAQSELGELVYVEVDTVGEELAKDEIFGTVEAVKTTSDLFMPVGGKVLEFNSELHEDEGDNPGVINTDPYEAGWIIKIELSNMAELDDLMDHGAYEELTAS